MLICFYCDTANIAGKDCRGIDAGNPGMGGTEYMFLLLATYLSRQDNGLTVVFFCTAPITTEACLRVHCVNDDYDAVVQSRNLGADILVIKNNVYAVRMYELIDSLAVKTVVWGHNFLPFEVYSQYVACRYIVKHVCVGQQQYNRLFAHPLVEKSTFIYNTTAFPAWQTEKTAVAMNVVYMGGIYPSKGFHVLARQWKQIHGKIPEARLQVIGSGNLYDGRQVLGPFGIADSAYERVFMPHLLDEQGKLLPSVQFFGNLGREKYPVFRAAAVGVVPCVDTETFCISAVEMSAAELPVVSIGRMGLLDTVVDQVTGLLVNREQDLASAVVWLLQNPAAGRWLGQTGRKYVATKFAIAGVARQWQSLFTELAG